MITAREKPASVEQWPITRLEPYAKNARRHPPEQIERLAASIKKWGWTVPILIDEKGGILAGHGRLEAAKSLSIEKVPVIVAKGWSVAKKKAYVIADNQITLGGEWDKGLLSAEIADLKALGFDLQLLGFDAASLRALSISDTADPDAVPAAQKEIVSRAGEVWKLGDHRIICGDCTDAKVVKALMGSRCPHLMVTDPPYGVEYDPDWRNRADRANGKPYGARAVGVVHNDERVDWTEAWALFPGDVAYVWHAGRHASAVQASLEAVDFEIRCQIIWAKDNFSISRGHYHWQHEPCWYAVKNNGHWSGGRGQTTLWTIPKPPKSETGHSTQKPVECMKRPIENNSKAGDFVYDPFCGSGTTLIAAEMTARACLAIELAPNYVDLAVRRWEEFTGKEAKLDASGATFADTARKRRRRKS